MSTKASSDTTTTTTSKRGKKRPRHHHAWSQSTKNASSPVYDLMVSLPKENTSLHSLELQQRLASTGFTHMALTHTIFGAPRLSEDKAETAVPDSLLQPKSGSSIKVLRRLHAVLENLSDVGYYAKRRQDNIADSSSLSAAPNTNNAAKILQEYDIVSLSPRNDATFQSACVSATASDIITLDYTSGRGGVQLPFKIRPADVKAVVARKAVFEIPYAPAILNRNQRKGLIQTCRLLQMASLSSRPKVILSSGSRNDASVGGGDEDVGVMAPRNPSDLENVMQVVMKMDSKMAHEALRTAGSFALEQAQVRRFGNAATAITGIYVADKKEMTDNNDDDDAGGSGENEDDMAKEVSKKECSESKDDISKGSSSHSDEEMQNDGFISF